MFVYPSALCTRHLAKLLQPWRAAGVDGKRWLNVGVKRDEFKQLLRCH